MRRCFIRGARTASALLAGSLRRAASTSEDPVLHSNDSFLSGSSAMYFDQLYEQWRADPQSVDESWQRVFSSQTAEDFSIPILDTPIRVVPVSHKHGGASKVGSDLQTSFEDCAKAMRMISAFEDKGHLVADVDPLNYDRTETTFRTPSHKMADSVSLELSAFGFSAEDAKREIAVFFSDMAGGVRAEPTVMTVEALHNHLQKWYCGKIAVEVSHISNPEIKRYIRSQVETFSTQSALHRAFTPAEKKALLDSIAVAVYFEDFFKRKYTTAKRFGADGIESMVLGLRTAVDTAAGLGATKVNMCMAHRGRLNVLINVIGKPFEVLLKEFTGVSADDLKPFRIQSDVKYHLGCNGARPAPNGKSTKLEMLCNPSHLEAVNPVLQGYTKANQNAYAGEEGKQQVLPIEIHGDAAFAGQGVAFESMCLSEVGEFGTGGTIHVVCNNQVGFTTNPSGSRSSAHCTALGKVFGCPIIRVNADSPEDVARVFQFAAEFRMAFHKSIVIDLVGYRRFGHNENDDPSMTQPVMYEKIKNFPDVFDRYSKTLVEEGVMTAAEVSAMASAAKKHYNDMQKSFTNVKYSDFLASGITENWKNMKYSDQFGKVTLQPTAITPETTQTVLKAMQTYPAGFKVHSKLSAVLDRRNDTIKAGEGIDWGTAEALAFGSLLMEGDSIRLTGQDVQRGTFAQRHAVLHDQVTDALYAPLSGLAKQAGQFTVLNSPLSEYGTLGYAVGYSLFDPKCLTIWEAQYGDFANGAAIVFDQFLSSGEDKWNQQQACVVSMPHGYDGKGAEHSSGRIERFLQGSNEEVTTPALSKQERLHGINWEVVYPSTPAQYFHLLRRHMKRDFRKTLVIFFSKQFLRAPNVSSIADFQGSSEFQSVIGDPVVTPAKCKRLVLCTGQLYFILLKYRDSKKITDVALVRVEELSPFPRKEVEDIIKAYGKAELVWAQEEPKNMGAWGHVEPRIAEYTNHSRPLRFVGRAINAAPSTGYHGRHDAEQEFICKSALE